MRELGPDQSPAHKQFDGHVQRQAAEKMLSP